MASERFQCLRNFISDNFETFELFFVNAGQTSCLILKKETEKLCSHANVLIPLKFWPVNYACQLQDEDE